MYGDQTSYFARICPFLGFFWGICVAFLWVVHKLGYALPFPSYIIRFAMVEVSKGSSAVEAS